MNTKDNQESLRAIKELIDKQQPLPADMAKVLYDSLWNLYEDSANLTTPQVNEEVASGDLKEALAFIKTHDCIDEEGYEYGICRVKFDINGHPLSVLWSDLESALALKKRKGIV